METKTPQRIWLVTQPPGHRPAPMGHAYSQAQADEWSELGYVVTGPYELVRS